MFSEPVSILFVSIYLYSVAFPKWKSNAFMGFVDLFTLIHIAHLRAIYNKELHLIRYVFALIYVLHCTFKVDNKKQKNITRKKVLKQKK